MKRLITIILAVGFVFSMSVCALAAPKKMSDGGVFDAEFYAANNPDVVAAIGTSADILYLHYVNYGAAEGRLPYGTDAATLSQVLALSAPKNIINNSGSATAYMTLVQAYMKLPPKYKQFIEKNKIRITLKDGAYSSNAVSNGAVTIYNNSATYGEGTLLQSAQISVALYHELGHEYDFIQARNNKGRLRIAVLDPFPSSEISNIEAASEVVETYDNGYRTMSSSVYDPDEIFAVLSSCYFYNPGRLQSVCPVGYAYIDKYYSQFK